MSTQAAPTPGFMRHALGMPAGSVRAILAVAILLYLWVMAVGTGPEGKGLLFQGQIPAKDGVGNGYSYASTAFVYLHVVMVVILCHFIVAHGKTIGHHVSHHSLLWMPRGTMRIVLLGGYFALAYWTFQFRGDYPDPDLHIVFLVVAIVLAAFLLGHTSTSVMRWLYGTLPPWFLDMQAWFSCIAVVLLAWVLMARLVINPHVNATTQLTLQYSEAAMAAFVGFYFGARS